MGFDKPDSAHIGSKVEDIAHIMHSGAAGAQLPEVGADIFCLREDLIPLGERFAIDHTNFQMSGPQKIGDQMSPNESTSSRYKDLSILLHISSLYSCLSQRHPHYRRL